MCFALSLAILFSVYFIEIFLSVNASVILSTKNIEMYIGDFDITFVSAVVGVMYIPWYITPKAL